MSHSGPGICACVGGKRKRRRNLSLLFLTVGLGAGLMAEEAKGAGWATASGSRWLSTVPGARGFVFLIVLCHFLSTCPTTRGPHTCCASQGPGRSAPFSKGQGLGSSKLVCPVTQRGCRCNIIHHGDCQPWLCVRAARGVSEPPKERAGSTLTQRT